MNRRNFLAGTAAATALTTPQLQAAGTPAKPALLGGTPVRREPFPSWPVRDTTEEQAMVNVVRSGKWFRGSGQAVAKFEEEYAKLTGAQRCLATANGTSALLV